MNELEKLTKREQARLLATYKASEKAIKAKLEQALLKGNNAAYIRRVQREIGAEIATLEKEFNKYAQQRLPLIYETQGIKVDNQINSFEAKFDIENSFGKTNTKALEAIAQNTQKGLKGITLQMGRQSAGYLRRIGLMTARDIVVGSETWNSAAKAMTANLKAKDFFYVKYKLKSGKVRKVPAEVYSKMVARTTAAEAYRISTTERITSRGYDLVKVIGISSFPNSPCIPYQGKSLSITGRISGYTTLETARADGFNHPQCIHSLVFSQENYKYARDRG